MIINYEINSLEAHGMQPWRSFKPQMEHEDLQVRFSPAQNPLAGS